MLRGSYFAAVIASWKYFLARSNFLLSNLSKEISTTTEASQKSYDCNSIDAQCAFFDGIELGVYKLDALKVLLDPSECFKSVVRR